MKKYRIRAGKLRNGFYFIPTIYIAKRNDVYVGWKWSLEFSFLCFSIGIAKHQY